MSIYHGDSHPWWCAGGVIHGVVNNSGRSPSWLIKVTVQLTHVKNYTGSRIMWQLLKMLLRLTRDLFVLLDRAQIMNYKWKAVLYTNKIYIIYTIHFIKLCSISHDLAWPYCKIRPCPKHFPHVTISTCTHNTFIWSIIFMAFALEDSTQFTFTSSCLALSTCFLTMKTFFLTS